MDRFPHDDQPQVHYVPPASAPPTYEQAMGAAAAPPPPPVNPYIPPERKYLNTATIVATVVPIGEGSTHMICPKCQSEIDTTTRSEPSLAAALISCLLCFMGCWICAIVPCCLEECRDVHHRCPNCHEYIGKHPADMTLIRQRPVIAQPIYFQAHPQRSNY